MSASGEDAALRGRIAEAYHRHQYGDNGTHDTLREADDVAAAIIADLGIEQAGWLEDADTDDPAPIKMKHGEAFYAGDVGVCVPLYRLSDIGRTRDGES